MLTNYRSCLARCDQKIIYGVTMAVVAVLGFVKLFLLAKVLGVEGFGYYSLFLAIEAYLIPLLTGGILESVFRQYPILLGKGDRSSAEALRNRAFIIIFSIVLVEMLLVSFGVLMLIQLDRYGWSLWLFAVGAHVSITTLYFMVLREIRSRLKSIEYSLAMFVRGVMDVSVLLFLFDEISTPLYLLVEVVVLVLISSCLFVRVPRFWGGQSGELQGMVSAGLTLLSSSSVGTFAITGDRLLLGVGLSAQQFSNYAFNGIIFQGGMSFSNIVHQYIHPLIMQVYGRDGGVDNIYYVMHIWFRRFLLVSLCISPLAWFVYSYVMTDFYSEFRSGATLFLCLFFAAVIHAGNAFGLILIAAGQYRLLFLCQISSVVFLLTVMGGGMFLNLSLEYYAAAFLACRVLSLVLLVSSSRRLLVAR